MEEFEKHFFQFQLYEYFARATCNKIPHWRRPFLTNVNENRKMQHLMTLSVTVLNLI